MNQVRVDINRLHIDVRKLISILRTLCELYMNLNITLISINSTWISRTPFWYQVGINVDVYFIWILKHHCEYEYQLTQYGYQELNVDIEQLCVDINMGMSNTSNEYQAPPCAYQETDIMLLFMDTVWDELLWDTYSHWCDPVHSHVFWRWRPC